MSYLTIDGLEDEFPSSVEISNPLGKSFISIDISMAALPKCDSIRLYLTSRSGQLKDAEVVPQIMCDMWNAPVDVDEFVAENDNLCNVGGYVPGNPETLPDVESPRVKRVTKSKTKKSDDISEVSVIDIVTDIADEVVYTETDYTSTEDVQKEDVIEAEEDNFICEICESDCVDDEYGAYDESEMPEYEDEYNDTDSEEADEAEDETDEDNEEISSDDVAESEEKPKRKKKEKAPKKPKAPKVKFARQSGRLVSQIATPTCTGNVAPTLMATGYGTATYKNLYSVGHFPKLGVFEIWEDDEVSVEKPVETVHYEREMNIDINESESGVIDAGSMVTHKETDMVVDNNVTEDDKKKYIYVVSEVNSGDAIRDKFGLVKNGFGSDPLF